MKKEKGKLHRNIIISLCFLSVVGFGSYICYLFLSPEKPTQAPYNPQTPPTTQPEAPKPIQTNLSGLLDTLDIELQNSNTKVDDFKETVITKLSEQPKYEKLTKTDVDITKSNGDALLVSDIMTT